MRPAVVLIQIFDKDQVPLGQGSGSFIGPKGDLDTNKHVINGAHTATVRLAGGALYLVEGVSAADEGWRHDESQRIHDRQSLLRNVRYALTACSPQTPSVSDFESSLLVAPVLKTMTVAP